MKKNNTVGLIGAGNIGSRHLQGLARLEIGCEIWVVEPSENASALAHHRFLEIAPTNHFSLKFIKSITALPKQLDLVIVATSADVRYSILEELLGYVDVRYLILEKVLFQEIKHHYLADKILEGLSERTWINCSQRYYPFFIDIKERFGNSRCGCLDVYGSNWGLACNAVHNVDLATYFWGSSLSHKLAIEPYLKDAKRQGFKEFYGQITTDIFDRGVVRQTCVDIGSFPLTYRFVHPDIEMTWCIETAEYTERSASTLWRPQSRRLYAPFQSDLTTKIVQEILTGGNCMLPRYKENSHIHRGILEQFIVELANMGVEYSDHCPIT